MANLLTGHLGYKLLRTKFIRHEKYNSVILFWPFVEDQLYEASCLI